MSRGGRRREGCKQKVMLKPGAGADGKGLKQVQREDDETAADRKTRQQMYIQPKHPP